MAINGNPKLASQRTAQLAQAVTVGRFTRYEDAQAAVDLLTQRDFPVRNLTIVGTGLRQVEHVVAPLSYARAAGSGAVQGLFYGVLLALLMLLFTGEQWWVALFTALPVAVAFWMIFAVIAYARRGQQRNFAAVGQLVADQYELRCAPQEAQEARRLLSGGGPAGPGQATFGHGGFAQGGFGQSGFGQDGAGQNAGHDGGAAGSDAGSHAPGAQASGLQGPGQQASGQQGPGFGAPGSQDQQDPVSGDEAGARPAAPGESAEATGNQAAGDQTVGQQAAGEESPRRERPVAKDFQDLEDGRPRYGLREGEDE